MQLHKGFNSMATIGLAHVLDFFIAHSAAATPMSLLIISVINRQNLDYSTKIHSKTSQVRGHTSRGQRGISSR